VLQQPWSRMMLRSQLMSVLSFAAFAELVDYFGMIADSVAAAVVAAVAEGSQCTVAVAEGFAGSSVAGLAQGNQYIAVAEELE